MTIIKSPKSKKFIHVTDAHIGYENERKGLTDYVVTTTHNSDLLKRIWELSKSFKPDYVILGGDNLNCGPVSHWSKGKPKLQEGFRLKRECELLEELILDPIRSQGIKNKVTLTGNHEDWIRQYLQDKPELDGFVDIERKYYHDFKVLSLGDLYQLGKLFFTHGDTAFRRGGSTSNPAKKLVQSYHRNVVAGHLHTNCSSTETTAIDQIDVHCGWLIGCASKLNFDYGLKSPNNCVNGFSFGYIKDNGDFSIYPVVATGPKGCDFII